ncbi:MAG: hypothetical protein M0R03_20610 [Novosphingobium sp.]|nr:hypothetical protein [Novosphingobium sp.]
MVIINGKEQWARDYKKCKMCKKTDSEHRQNGLCVKCWAKLRYEKEKEYRKEYYKKYWEKKKFIKNKAKNSKKS